MILSKWLSRFIHHDPAEVGVLSERDGAVTATRELLTARSLRVRSELTKKP